MTALTVTAVTGGHSSVTTHVSTYTQLLSHPDDSKIWQEYQDCWLLTSDDIRSHRRAPTFGWICCFRQQGTTVLSLGWRQHDPPELCNKAVGNRLTTLSHYPTVSSITYRPYQPLGLRTKWKYTAKSNVSTRISMEHSDRETAQHADRNSAARGQKLRSTRTETCPSATTRRNNSWLETSAASIWELQTSQKKLILPATVLRILQPLSSQTRSNELWHDCSSRMTTDIPDVSGQTSLTLTR